ncbi:MAG: hypothetical protein BGO69_14890 [Bacteroidetes bacterium 46-16]|nr:MAG: hypothetical protein BGO69_14890 [Bacteroidetes bacterium 46-16]
MGNFSMLKALPDMYRICKATEDKDMSPLDFITDHLINIDGLFDKHTNGDEQKPHQNSQSMHQLQQPGYFITYCTYSVQCFYTVAVEPLLETVKFAPMNYVSDVFRPPENMIFKSTLTFFLYKKNKLHFNLIEMKKIVLVAITLLFANAMTFAQGKVPNAVNSAFNQKFKNATKVKWDKENPHEYEAEFQWYGLNYSANFDDNGNWLETESQFSFNQLPEKIQSAFNNAHKGAVIKAIAKIETSKGEHKYEVEIKKGVSTAELFYTAEGKEVKE